MGCDIHLITQARETAESPWSPVKVDYRCPDCEGTGKVEHKNPEYTRCIDCRGTGKARGYDRRNYDMFAQLADVRNGRGFAGIKTGEGFIPISKPRGLPEGYAPPDVDDEELWLGDHSHSWLTLAELLAYDIERCTTHQGVLSKAEWEAWDRKGPPRGWCGDVMGPGVRIVSDEVARSGDEPFTYVRVHWGITYRQAGGIFWSDFVPALQKLGAPENVRIIFGFDS